MRTIQIAVAQKRLPLRCILCRAKVLRLHQEGRRDTTNLPKSVSGYNIAYNISSSPSNYSFSSGSVVIPPHTLIMIYITDHYGFIRMTIIGRDTSSLVDITIDSGNVSKPNSLAKITNS